ncbi:MAG: cbb3-type cytochrome c oxidase subunit I, partial [Persicimonas sp.]
GIGLQVRVGFMMLTMLIAVPTGIKIFSWLATMWGGSLRLDTPMLYAVGFLAMFTLGGLSGVVLASVPVDIELHDTYYVVAHIHYVLVAGSVMTIFAGLYYWFPKLTGKMYNELLGKVHFWLTAIFINVTFFGMHYLGVKGMPRRYYDYDPQFEMLNAISSYGAYILFAAQFIWVGNMLWSLKNGEDVGKNPWKDGQHLEWHTTSPPQHHNFPEPPVWTPIDRAHGPHREADELTEPVLGD